MFCCASIASYREHVTIHKNLFFRWEIILMLLSFAVVFGMRYDVGEDHLGYLDGYINPFLHKEYEPLFALIRDTLRKDCKFLYPALIVSLFMGQFFIHWMNGIRQDIAGCIFLCAITCVIDKRIVGFFTLVLISVGFHYSAVILFPFYFLYLKKDHYFNSINVQYLLLFVVSYVAIYNVDLLTNINDTIFYLATLSGYEMYTEDVLYRFADITKTGVSMYVFILLDLIIVSYCKKMKCYYYGRKFNIIYDLYFFGTLAQIVFVNNLVLARPFRYFRGFKLVVIACLIFFLYKKSRQSINAAVLFMVVVLLLILFAATIKNEPFHFMPV